MKKYLYTMFFLLSICQATLAQEDNRYQLGLNVFQITSPPSAISFQSNIYLQPFPQLFGKILSPNAQTAFRFTVGYQQLKNNLYHEDHSNDKIYSIGQFDAFNLVIGIEKRWQNEIFTPYVFSDLSLKNGVYQVNTTVHGFFTSVIDSHVKSISTSLQLGLGIQIDLHKKWGINIETAVHGSISNNDRVNNQTIYSGSYKGEKTNTSKDQNIWANVIPLNQLGVFYTF